MKKVPYVLFVIGAVMYNPTFYKAFISSYTWKMLGVIAILVCLCIFWEKLLKLRMK